MDRRLVLFFDVEAKFGNTTALHGVHDIHMNEDNVGAQAGDNGVSHEGGYTSEHYVGRQTVRSHAHPAGGVILTVTIRLANNVARRKMNFDNEMSHWRLRQKTRQMFCSKRGPATATCTRQRCHMTQKTH
jgi:hypothetical protein